MRQSDDMAEARHGAEGQRAGSAADSVMMMLKCVPGQQSTTRVVVRPLHELLHQCCYATVNGCTRRCPQHPTAPVRPCECGCINSVAP
eukprot:4336686-Alexandrium_andersonii.AAC.1